MNIGEKIKHARLSKDLTRKGLADRIDVAENSIRRYEKGEFNPPVEKLIEISHVLGVSMDWLTRDEDVELDGKAKAEFFAEDYMDAHNDIVKAIDHWLEIGNPMIIKEKNGDKMETTRIEMVDFDERVMLLAAYYKLNDKGKHEALKRMKQMSEIREYQAETAE